MVKLKVINLIKTLLPSTRTKRDLLTVRMRTDSPCLYSPIPINDLKLTFLIRNKINKARLKPAVINSPDYSKKLAIIVPYRHREQHLAKFPSYIKKFLAKENIKNEIIIVEQADNVKPFNKGMLLNIGAKFFWDNYDYFCFHDIDMLPENASYACINHPVLLANSASQFDHTNTKHETYFGGVVMFTKEQFLQINGFSNNYWHWGYEDDDSFFRCLISGLTPVAYKDGCFKSLPHEKSIKQSADGQYQQDEKKIIQLKKLFLVNRKYYKKVRRGIIDTKLDGLNNLHFKIINKEQNDLYTKISVII